MTAPSAPPSAIVYIKPVVSGSDSRAVDIYSKVGACLECEQSYAQNCCGVSASSPGQGLRRQLLRDHRL